MAVPDGTLLGVAEAGDAFVAPDPPPATTARHFRRYPRPEPGHPHRTAHHRSPGGLDQPTIARATPRPCGTGPTSSTSATSPRPRVPGYTQITAYENAVDTDPRFMHFYELDSDDPEATYMAMAQPHGQVLRLGRATARPIQTVGRLGGGRRARSSTEHLPPPRVARPARCLRPGPV